jgi:hypothetical protein
LTGLGETITEHRRFTLEPDRRLITLWAKAKPVSFSLFLSIENAHGLIFSDFLKLLGFSFCLDALMWPAKFGKTRQIWGFPKEMGKTISVFLIFFVSCARRSLSIHRVFQSSPEWYGPPLLARLRPTESIRRGQRRSLFLLLVPHVRQHGR